MSEHMEIAIAIVGMIVMVGVPVWLVREVRAHAKKSNEAPK
jgi:hypothetical protein